MNRAKFRKGITSVVAHCHDCDKSFEGYADARDQARQHARSTGHYVVGEVVRPFSYGSEKRKKDAK